MTMKKKNIFQWIALSLVGCFVFGAVGCNGNVEESINALDYTSIESTEGVHIYNVKPTSNMLVENGKTEYKVVTSETPSRVEQTAVKELIYFFNMATGITLQTVSETQANYTQDAKYISIGDTALVEQAAVEADYEVLGDTGLTIQTNGQSIFLLGAKEYGTLYAVYEFLSQAFNYEYFASNLIQIDRNVKDVPLMDYDIVDVPDYEYNLATYGFIRSSETIRNRYRMADDSKFFIPVGGKMYHNSFEWLPKTNYEEAHPSWYSDDGTQLCYTAHGEEQEYNLMLNAALEKAKELLSDPQYFDRPILTFTQQDTQTWCECDTCAAEKQKYGTNAAVVVKFVNALRRLIDTWFAGDGAEYKRDFTLLFFAYHLTNNSPTVYDEKTNTYKAIDGSVKCAPGVGVYFAETDGDYQQNFSGVYNRTIGRNMAGWGACAEDMFFWSYSVNFSHYLTPYNSFNAMQDIYKYGVKNNAHFLFDQGQYNQDGKPTGWCILKIYLSSKLAWNVNLSVEQLIDEFFNAYFGPAAASMKGMFESFRVQALVNESNGYTGAKSIFHNAMRNKYWSRSLLKNWLAATEQALEDIDGLKETDSTMYETYKLNIRIERLQAIYLLVELYQSYYSEEQINAYRQEFLEIATEMGITRVDESMTTPADLYWKWGL